MENKKGKVLLVAILIVLLMLLAFLTYLLYQYIPGEPQELKAVIKETKLEIGDSSYKVKQFYPNMKFNHNYISYKIDSECNERKRERMSNAFSELANKVEFISFHSINEESKSPDIYTSCTEKNGDLAEEAEKDFFIAGEGGAKEIIQTGRYSVITNGVILLYGDSRETIECDWPNVELHELLHVFGFEHSQDKSSLMHPYLESCEQKLDESIVNNLKQLYSQENLADLYFEDVKAIKKGKYLDFNVTVKNLGVIDAENVSLSVFDENEEVESFNLKDIPFGGGITFQVANLKLRNRNSENIGIIIDPKNLIKEIDKDNNIAKLEFG